MIKQMENEYSNIHVHIVIGNLYNSRKLLKGCTYRTHGNNSAINIVWADLQIIIQKLARNNEQSNYVWFFCFCLFVSKFFFDKTTGQQT